MEVVTRKENLIGLAWFFGAMALLISAIIIVAYWPAIGPYVLTVQGFTIAAILIGPMVPGLIAYNGIRKNITATHAAVENANRLAASLQGKKDDQELRALCQFLLYELIRIEAALISQMRSVLKRERAEQEIDWLALIRIFDDQDLSVFETHMAVFARIGQNSVIANAYAFWRVLVTYVHTLREAAEISGLSAKKQQLCQELLKVLNHIHRARRIAEAIAKGKSEPDAEKIEPLTLDDPVFVLETEDA